jgi:hypothetical protein
MLLRTLAAVRSEKYRLPTGSGVFASGYDKHAAFVSKRLSRGK